MLSICSSDQRLATELLIQPYLGVGEQAVARYRLALSVANEGDSTNTAAERAVVQIDPCVSRLMDLMQSAQQGGVVQDLLLYVSRHICRRPKTG